MMITFRLFNRRHFTTKQYPRRASCGGTNDQTVLIPASRVAFLLNTPQRAKKCYPLATSCLSLKLQREGDGHVSKAHENFGRFRGDPSSARAWCRIFCAWRAKGPGFVRRIRLPGHARLLYPADAHPGSEKKPSVPRKPNPPNKPRA